MSFASLDHVMDHHEDMTHIDFRVEHSKIKEEYSKYMNKQPDEQITECLQHIVEKHHLVLFYP